MELALRRAARIAAIAVTIASPLLAQEPKPAVLVPSQFDPAVFLSLAWRFQPGDDPAWASPRLDDRSWKTAEPALPRGQLAGSAWPGVAWFRRHLRVSPAFGSERFAMRVGGFGDAKIYLDGTLVAHKPAERYEDPRLFFFNLSPSADHVLAVRYELADAGRFADFGIDPGFVAYFGPAGAFAQEEARSGRRSALQEGGLLAGAGVLALVHLALYWFYPRARENLYCAFVLLAFAVIAWSSYELGGTGRTELQLLLLRLVHPAVLSAIYFTLLTYYAVRCPSPPRTSIGFTAVFAALTAGAIISPALFTRWAWPAFFALMLLEIVRIERSGRVITRLGTGILLPFLALDCVFVVLQVLVNFGIIGGIAGFTSVYLLAMIAFGLGMSLFLARNFAGTALDLERKLSEVSALGGRVLAQEREAHEQELRARLLAAENARSARELDQARALQLSMLPKHIPQLPGLDVAVSMTTASEVGGDYYDFRAASDGSLVVAIGDATGHGAAAGTMVTATKALFATLGDDASLTGILRETSRALREMTVSLQMCLALGRLTPRSVSFASAAMPPLLLYRAATGEVSELGTGGLPLGSSLAGTYEERTATLEPGDTLLFASDGLAEMLDPSGSPLGFEGAAEAFRSAAGESAQEVIDRLVAAAASWCGSSEQTDDMTLVVVRISEPSSRPVRS